MFNGSMVALVTPFKNGKVDKKALKGAWIDFLRHPIDVPMETMQKVALFGASLAQKAPKAKASKAKASKAPKVAV